MVMEMVSKSTLVTMVCGYLIMGSYTENLKGVDIGASPFITETSIEINATNPASFYGSPLGIVVKAEQEIEEGRVYVSVANRSGKWLDCDFGGNMTVRLSPEDVNLEILPHPIDINKMPKCLVGSTSV